MNTDTGEIRQFQKQDMEAQLEALRAESKAAWVKLTAREAARLEPLPPAERPAALNRWHERKARLHAAAVARGKR